jgi:hypothetical protein
MTRVSTIRLAATRAMYLFMALGLALTVWPTIVAHDLSMPRMTGVALALLGTIGLLSLIGLRYPLQMIPLLLFELSWKIIWLAFFALPLWLEGRLDQATASTVFDTSLGLVLLLVIPWRYVIENYVRKPAEPWRRAARLRHAAEAAGG